MERGLLGLPWLAWAVGAFALSLIYAVVVPLASATHGLEHVVLRWFHALVWLLLGLSALARGFLQDVPGLAQATAGTALALYIVYLGTLTRARARHQAPP